MSIDLLPEKLLSGSWTRSFGDHEAAGAHVSTNAKSALVALTALGDIQFVVSREDVPSAWAKSIDVAQLRKELIAAVVLRASTEVIEALFKEIHKQQQSAFCAGTTATQAKIKEALGL